MTHGGWTSYDFAVVRVVPRVHLGCFVKGGVVLQARTAEYLAARLLTDPARLRERVPGLDAERLSRYLLAWGAVVEGDPAAGPVALVPPSERFHWLTAHRSDVLQTSPIHEGLSRDPEAALAELYAAYVPA
jgi:hypothetical protein